MKLRYLLLLPELVLLFSLYFRSGSESAIRAISPAFWCACFCCS